MNNGHDLWPIFEPVIGPLLGADDDPALWGAVINAVLPDAQLLSRLIPDRWNVVTQLGRCSHWLRPHQTRWKADGGFVWPTGYGGQRWSRLGLPEFDWFRQWSWCRDTACWVRSSPPRPVVFRVAVPSRSRRHLQAAVHTIWQPDNLLHCDVDLMQFYGFRQQAGGSWACTGYYAYQGKKAEILYERANELQTK